MTNKIYEHLNKNNCYPESIYEFEQDGFSIVKIEVDGDWKHDHLYCKFLMQELGYIRINVVEIGHSDSDWYRAEHTYAKPA